MFSSNFIKAMVFIALTGSPGLTQGQTNQQAMEKLLSRIGVNADTTIVPTDNMANRAAVRMYYTLKYFGHKDVRILHGGTEVWKALAVRS